MNTKKQKSKKVKKIISVFFLVVVSLYLLLSISPRNAVRMTVALSGHPSSAIKCSPKHSAFFSEQMNANVYEINYKYGYNHFGMSHVVLFRVHTFLIFHVATGTYRYA
jgi:hypothetical protein